MVETILEAAGQLLVEKGYQGATTTAIAERAGVSIGSLYQYFGTREELFQELVRRHGQTFHAPLIEAGQRLLSGKESPLAVLGDLTRAIVAAHTARPELMAALELELPKVGPPETARWQAEMTAESSRFLAAQLPGDPECRLADAWVATVMIASVARALGHNPPEGVDPQKALEAVERALAAILGGKP